MYVCVQLSARYYMEYTGMDRDRVEMNTNRDYFMTPEDAVLEVSHARMGPCAHVPMCNSIRVYLSQMRSFVPVCD